MTDDPFCLYVCILAVAFILQMVVGLGSQEGWAKNGEAMNDKKTIGMLKPQDGWEGYKFWCSTCNEVIGQSVIPYLKCPRCGKRTVSIYQESQHQGVSQ